MYAIGFFSSHRQQRLSEILINFSLSSEVVVTTQRHYTPSIVSLSFWIILARIDFHERRTPVRCRHARRNREANSNPVAAMSGMTKLSVELRSLPMMFGPSSTYSGGEREAKQNHDVSPYNKGMKGDLAKRKSFNHEESVPRKPPKLAKAFVKAKPLAATSLGIMSLVYAVRSAKNDLPNI